jgi:site-specific DNA-adenine methylase
MVRYQGGKTRIGKELYQVMTHIEKLLYNRKLPLLEPFCGMCGVTQHFSDGRKIYASDINEDIVLMWQHVMKGWKPRLNISEEYYNKLRYDKTSSPERGFFGTSCSFTGRYQKSKNDAKVG